MKLLLLNIFNINMCERTTLQKMYIQTHKGCGDIFSLILDTVMQHDLLQKGPMQNRNYICT
jgi:hypothetical protein